ncbi:MAG: hypothetical protein N2485_08215, partial [bacterium]|nr:hypothetical protein [bacterium]
MIFDLFLEKTTIENSFQSNPSINNFLLELYSNEKIKNSLFNYKNEMFNLFGFGRQINDNIFDDNGNLYIIIGEVFPRLDNNFFTSYKKINAKGLCEIYKIKGDKFIDFIKGNFQIIIIENYEIKIFNSRYGVSPFYYYYDSQNFICSTAIYLFPNRIRKKLKFSPSNLLEYAIFNYPLGENTLFENVFNLLPGEILIYKNKKLLKRKYFDVTDLISNERISKNLAIEKGVELFNKVVNNLTLDKERLAVSLTGGFDGRAILSALKFPKDNLLLYSFGIRGSLNIKIPIRISSELGYKFNPYYLENEYSKVYPDYAVNTCLLTDCLATVQRANYLYVFEDLSSFSDT